MKAAILAVRHKPEAVRLLVEAVPLSNLRSNDATVRNMRYIAWRVILADAAANLSFCAYAHYRRVVDTLYGGDVQ